MNGIILNVQRACTRDGPGIRTTVFFKGCPLRCAWCHNPETQARAPELLYRPDACLRCFRCAAVCPAGCHSRTPDGSHRFDRARCTACGRCLSPLCPALEKAGKTVSVEEVMAVVLRDRAYYERSGGGLTLSGGEPLYQPEFCLELLAAAKREGLHTCVETCGAASPDVLARAAALTDRFLYDCKETDPDRHRALTGADPAPILANLALLDRLGKPVSLRCPVIPTVNDRPDHFAAVADLANRYRVISEVVLEPYHTLGVGKYERLGRPYSLGGVVPAAPDAVGEWVRAVASQTSVPVVSA